MTTYHYRTRPAPALDEPTWALSLARYLGKRIHPAVAVILAYEDATGTGSGGCQFRKRIEARSTTTEK